MQEEVNEKIITLSVQGARITASMVKAAMRKFLMELEREGQKSSHQTGRKAGSGQGAWN